MYATGRAPESLNICLEQSFVNNTLLTELQMQLNLTDVLVFISKVVLLCAIACVVSYFQSFRFEQPGISGG